MKVKALDHIHVYAADPAASAEFYTAHFDAAVVHRNSNANDDLRIFLAVGGQIVVLGSFPAGLRAQPPPEAGDGAYRHGFGVAHLGFRVEDVGRAVAELAAANVPIVSQPVTEQTGLVYAYIAAPDGVMIELTQYEVPG